MTYNVFGGTLNLAQSISLCVSVCVLTRLVQIVATTRRELSCMHTSTDERRLQTKN